MKNNENIKTVYRWYWNWDFKKAESWLNAMSMQGWALKKIGFCKYTFEKCAPNEYAIRLEFRPALQKANADYVAFLEDLGAEYIGRCANMVFFRRKTELGEFELFSDNASKKAHLDLIAGGVFAIMMMNLIVGIFNCTLNRAFGFGWISLVVAGVLAYGLGKINAARERLKEESTLYE